jgi:hypothetical protein
LSDATISAVSLEFGVGRPCLERVPSGSRDVGKIRIAHPCEAKARGRLQRRRSGTRANHGSNPAPRDGRQPSPGAVLMAMSGSLLGNAALRVAAVGPWASKHTCRVERRSSWLQASNAFGYDFRRED